jgi:hypothetical protein
MCRHNKEHTNKVPVRHKSVNTPILSRLTCVSGKYEDDLVLEVVVLLGTAAADEGCAMLLCKADILLSLIELLKGKPHNPSNQFALSAFSDMLHMYGVLVVNMALFVPFPF